jgi:hypothetical protein
LGLAIAAARQAHCKHRTFAHLARHGHVATHHPRELAGDGKAEPAGCSAVIPMPLSATVKLFRDFHPGRFTDRAARAFPGLRAERK